MKVWKYPIAISEAPTEHEMPQEAIIVHVAMQGSELCLWALVDPDQKRERRVFHVVPTGSTIPIDATTYVGTAHQNDSALLGFGLPELVWHVFEQ